MSQWRTFALSALLALTLGCNRALHAQEIGPKPFLGPADLRNQRPYQLLFLSFSPETATVLNSGQTRTGLQFDLANDLLIPYTYYGAIVREDTETQRLAVKASRGLGKGYEATLSASIMARDSGVLDKLVYNYHQWVGLTHVTPDVSVGRKNVRAYQSVVNLTDLNGKTIVNEGSAFGIGDVSATLKKQIVSNPWWSVAGRVGVKLPTGNASQLLGSGGTDFGADLDINIALARRFGFFANVSEVWMQNAPHLQGHSASHMGRTVLALEYYASQSARWIIQDDIAQAGVRTGNSFADGDQTIGSIVYKRETRPGTVWSFAFQENGDVWAYRAAQVSNIGPDVTLSVGWEHWK